MEGTLISNPTAGALELRRLAYDAHAFCRVGQQSLEEAGALLSRIGELRDGLDGPRHVELARWLDMLEGQIRAEVRRRLMVPGHLHNAAPACAPANVSVA